MDSSDKFKDLLSRFFPKTENNPLLKIKDIFLLFKFVRTYYANKVYEFSTKNEILYEKYFRLQAVHSTEPPSSSFFIVSQSTLKMEHLH